MSLRYLSALTLFSLLLSAGCHSQQIPDERSSSPSTPTAETLPPASPSLGSPEQSDEEFDPLSAICSGRKPCKEVNRTALIGPNTMGQHLLEVALHDLGEEGRRPNEPCALFEYWLLGRDAAPTLILGTCNDGYGIRRLGEDQVLIDGDRLIHRQFGGSNWTWITTTTIDLAHLKIEEEETAGAFSLGINAEKAAWNWNHLAGFVHWKAPICEEEEQLHEPHLDLHDLENTQGLTYRYDLLPQISLPEEFSQHLWRSTPLGSCSIEVNAEAHSGDLHGKGFVIHREPGDAAEARFRTIMGSPTELYVEITDPNLNFDHLSWLNQDHLEIWVGPPVGYHSHCIEPEAPRQWAISLLDGTVHSAQGSPDPGALRVEVAHEAADEPETIRVRIEFDEPPKALSVIYSDTFTGQRQDRLIATSDFRFGDGASLGRIQTIDAVAGHCIINDAGELEFRDLRRFEPLRPF